MITTEAQLTVAREEIPHIVRDDVDVAASPAEISTTPDVISTNGRDLIFTS
ncbi:MAG: hypothetical protein AB7U29_17470 [Desulfobulbus sp.]